jgi:hypothetical protein
MHTLSKVFVSKETWDGRHTISGASDGPHQSRTWRRSKLHVGITGEASKKEL